MSKKFVVCVDGLSQEMESKFKGFLEDLGWWHWMSGVWLVDSSDELTVSKIRDYLVELDKHINAIVLEVSPVTWASFGPESDDRSFSKWINSNWK